MCECVCMCVCVYMNAYIYVCMCVCVCVCVCVCYLLGVFVLWNPSHKTTSLKIGVVLGHGFINIHDINANMKEKV